MSWREESGLISTWYRKAWQEEGQGIYAKKIGWGSMMGGRKVDRENDKNYDLKGVYPMGGGGSVGGINMKGIEELEYGEG